VLPSGFSTFLPTIIQGLGKWTTAQVQLLTIPCYFLGAAAYMATAFLSDRLQMRGLFCVIFGTISVVGYGVLLADVAASVHYFACFLVAGGLYVVVGLPLAWVRSPFSRALITFGGWVHLMSDADRNSCLITHLATARGQLRQGCSLRLETHPASCLPLSSEILPPFP
jgi:hypothetical protein